MQRKTTDSRSLSIVLSSVSKEVNKIENIIAKVSVALVIPIIPLMLDFNNLFFLDISYRYRKIVKINFIRI